LFNKVIGMAIPVDNIKRLFVQNLNEIVAKHFTKSQNQSVLLFLYYLLLCKFFIQFIWYPHHSWKWSDV